jgi:hypothetical protein
MQGASFESAREEIGRDHAARTPVPHAGWSTANPLNRGMETGLYMVQTCLNYIRLLPAL